MGRASRRERETHRTREVAARAVRRLEFMEWALLAGAVALALAGGALLAALVAPSSGLPFRLVWAGASLGMFVVPGAVVLRRAKQEEHRERPSNLNEIEPFDV